MFAGILEGLKSSGHRISPASEMSLRGSAIHDAITSLIDHEQFGQDFRNSEPAVKSGFQQLKISGLKDNIIRAYDPYPFYGPCNYDFENIHHDMNDYNWINALMNGHHDLLKDAMLWIEDFAQRKQIAGRMTADETTQLKKILEEAALADPWRMPFIMQASVPIFMKIMPEAFQNNEEALKETVAKQMFSEIAGNDKRDRIVLSTVSSGTMSYGTITQLIPAGAKVILPIPYFDPFPSMLDMAKAHIITTDTTRTHFKLKAEDLRQLIKDNKMGPGDWLFLTSPNNATMASYTRKELQDIADVVAETGIRVLCDELYARLDKEPHVSLASLTSNKSPDGKTVRMQEQVITVTGFSKQFPFGSHYKLGAGLFPSAAEASKVEQHVKQIGMGANGSGSLLFKRFIDSTPQHIRDTCSQDIRQDVKRIQNAVNRTNIRFSNLHDGLRPYELITSDNGYLACLKLAPEVCQKFGIRTSDDLMSYMLATTGIATKSMMAEGVKEPMVRVNISVMARQLDDVEERLDKMVELMDARRPPTMSSVNKVMNNMICHHTPGVTSEQVSYARR